MSLENESHPSAFPAELFAECGFTLVDGYDGYGVQPPWATRRRTPRLFAWGLPAGVVRLAHRYPPIARRRETTFEKLLHWSFRADYVKAALAPEGDILIAVDLPSARLTVEGLDNLCQKFFELEEMPLTEFVEAHEITGFPLELARAVNGAVAGEEAADWERLTHLFSRVGFDVWQQDLRHGFRTFLDGYELVGVVNWGFGRIEIIGQITDAAFEGEATFARLLELNRKAVVAACGLDHDGVLRLSYHAPALTDGLPGQVTTQFAWLVPEARAAGR